MTAAENAAARGDDDGPGGRPAGSPGQQAALDVVDRWVALHADPASPEHVEGVEAERLVDDDGRPTRGWDARPAACGVGPGTRTATGITRRRRP